MKSLIVANWKLNPITAKEAKSLFDAVKKGAKSKTADVVICPPFLYLPLLKGLPLGAQNVFFEQKGAYTGEVSVPMLKDLKVEYVIVGHSERRKYFNETNELINKKLKTVLAENLKPIFCIGENEGEDKSQVLEKQLTEGLKEISAQDAKNITIAYEPVWAIGTGKNCSVQETVASVSLIKNIIATIYDKELADGIKMLYGGSVNSQNSGSYMKEGGVQGLLVGGASLRADEFVNIVKSAS